MKNIDSVILEPAFLTESERDAVNKLPRVIFSDGKIDPFKTFEGFNIMEVQKQLFALGSITDVSFGDKGACVVRYKQAGIDFCHTLGRTNYLGSVDVFFLTMVSGNIVIQFIDRFRSTKPEAIKLASDYGMTTKDVVFTIMMLIDVMLLPNYARAMGNLLAIVKK